MNKSEALKKASIQYTNHHLQTSGAWSVTEETAKEICKVLGVDYDSAIEYVDEMSYEIYHEELADEYAALRKILGEDAFELFEKSEAAEKFEDKHQGDYVGIEGTNNEYFWSYVLDNVGETE